MKRIIQSVCASLLGLVLGCAVLSPVSLAETTRVDSVDALHDALEGARPGDVIELADGEYPDAELRLHAKGTERRPVTVRAQTVGGVKLTGLSSLRLWGTYLVVEGLAFENGRSESADVIQFRRDADNVANHCRLTRCSIIGFNPPAADLGYKWVSIYGTHNRVDRCYFEGKTNDGTTLVVWLDGEPDHHRIDRNHFGYRPPLGRNGGETIRIGTSTHSETTSATVVENNLFDRCDGEIEVISNKSCENIFRGNTFDDCDGMLTIRHGARCVVEGNVFIGGDRPESEKFTGSGGVRVIGAGHVVRNNHFQSLRGTTFRAALSIMNGIPDSPLNGYYRVEDAVVTDNLVVDCTHPLTVCTGAGERGRTLPPKDTTYSGNVIINRGAPGEIAVLDQPVNWRSKDNTIFGSPVPPLLTKAAKQEPPRLAKAENGLWQIKADDAYEDQVPLVRLTAADVGPDSPAD